MAAAQSEEATQNAINTAEFIFNAFTHSTTYAVWNDGHWLSLHADLSIDYARKTRSVYELAISFPKLSTSIPPKFPELISSKFEFDQFRLRKSFCI